MEIHICHFFLLVLPIPPRLIQKTQLPPNRETCLQAEKNPRCFSSLFSAISSSSILTPLIPFHPHPHFTPSPQLHRPLNHPPSPVLRRGAEVRTERCDPGMGRTPRSGGPKLARSDGDRTRRERRYIYIYIYFWVGMWLKLAEKRFFVELS